MTATRHGVAESDLARILLSRGLAWFNGKSFSEAIVADESEPEEVDHTDESDPRPSFTPVRRAAVAKNLRSRPQ
jgi:hypothetical protein